MRRRNQRSVYGTPYQDPAGEEVGQEADEGFNSWLSRKNRSMGGRRFSVRPSRIGGGYGARARWSF